MEFDMSKICRCCRKKGPKLQSIFQSADKPPDTSLFAMLVDCVQMQILESDGLPKQLCANCVASVRIGFQFRKRYMASDAFLRECLAGRKDGAALNDDDDDDLDLGDMSAVKVELMDIKAEQIFIEANPLLEDEGGFDGHPEVSGRSRSGRTVKAEVIDSDGDGGNEGAKTETDDDSDFVADFGGAAEEVASSDDSVEEKELKLEPVKKKKTYTGGECNVCGRVFNRTYHLKRHIKTHENDIRCEFCERRFSEGSYKLYQQHMAEQHPGMPVQPQKKHVETKSEDIDEDKDYAVERDEACSDYQEDDGEPAASKKKKKKRRSNKKCTVCDKVFPSKYHLDRHVRSHKNDTQCEFCEQKFASMDYKDYRQHMLEEHPGMPLQPHKKEQEQDSAVLNDFRNANQKRQITCKICDTSFARIAELRNHLKSHVDPTTLANADIPTKPYLFQEGNVLENYLDHLVQQICKWDVLRFYQIVDPDGEELELSDSDSEPEEGTPPIPGIVHREHACSICFKSFTRLRYIMNHTRQLHKPEELLACRHCKLGFPNNGLLERHLKQQCENTHKKFQCEFCSKKFMWQTSLKKHAQSKHGAPRDIPPEALLEGGKPFICQVCNKGFAQMHHLKRHERGHEPSEKKFECPECHRKFHRKDNMKFHMKTHQEVRDDPPKQKHLCSLCGRGFTSNYNFTVHMRRHTGERPFKCDMCDKAFPRSLDLTYHRRTHTGDKPNVCTICGKAFSRHHRLIRHMRVHTGDRPYACTYCDRTFTQSNDLTLHIRRHTGEKPYACPVCDERFIQGTALRTHQRSAGHFTEDTAQPASNYGRSLLEG